MGLMPAESGPLIKLLRLPLASNGALRLPLLSNTLPMKSIVCFALLLLVALPFSGMAASAHRKGKLLHVVSFKFKETASKEDIRRVEEAFHALKAKIPGVEKLVWGTNVSPEKHDKGFTHCWVLTFNSEKDRDAYLVHPDHKKFGELVGPFLGDVFVVDFWSHE